MNSTVNFDVLLLDFGGVCLLNPVELHAVAEERLGLAPGTFDWLGPLDPSTDPLWAEMVSGSGVNEREYWAQRAADVGRAVGRSMELREYMELIYVPAEPDLIRPECNEVIDRSLAIGMGVSVLTNDLRAFHGPEWQESIPMFDRIDHLVDCSDTGILKPDPRAYERALSIIGAAPQRVLFVDDQPGNVAGAEASGLATHWFDIANANQSWHEVADRIGLP